MKRLFNAVISKLIKERMLLVIEDSTDRSLRKLTIHPNYIEH